MSTIRFRVSKRPLVFKIGVLLAVTDLGIFSEYSKQLMLLQLMGTQKKGCQAATLPPSKSKYKKPHIFIHYYMNGLT
jgi:hypothetical protein